MANWTRRALLGAAATSMVALPVVMRRFTDAMPRRVLWVHAAQPTSDGAGVKLHRALGHTALRDLDPFLLLDEFRSDDPSDYLAGFPDHPHRGFETVTIMLAGEMEHRDSVGNRGVLTPGSVQWMTAGRGIVHSEMPRQVQGRMWGFQLWVNLPASHKMIAPRYQDLGDVPTVDLGDATARVMAGEVGRVRGPVDGIVTRPTLLDVTLPAGGRFYVPVPVGHTVMAFVSQGSASFGGGAPVRAGHLAVLGAGDVVEIAGEGRVLVAAAAPLREPIARRGPFVMNTAAEIEQAYADYRGGRLGG